MVEEEENGSCIQAGTAALRVRLMGEGPSPSYF